MSARWLDRCNTAAQSPRWPPWGLKLETPRGFAAPSPITHHPARPFVKLAAHLKLRDSLLLRIEVDRRQTEPAPQGAAARYTVRHTAQGTKAPAHTWPSMLLSIRYPVAINRPSECASIHVRACMHACVRARLTARCTCVACRGMIVLRRFMRLIRMAAQ